MYAALIWPSHAWHVVDACTSAWRMARTSRNYSFLVCIASQSRLDASDEAMIAAAEALRYVAFEVTEAGRLAQAASQLAGVRSKTEVWRNAIARILYSTAKRTLPLLCRWH